MPFDALPSPGAYPAPDSIPAQGAIPAPGRNDPPGALPLPDAVLWDMDGTLVNTEPYWIAAETELAARHGGEWTQEDGLTIVGSSLTFLAEQMRARAGVPGTDTAIIDALLGAVIGQVHERGIPWRPGAPEMLAALRDAGIPSALVTSSYASLADVVVDGAPEGCFSAVVTGDAVTHGKPHPEPYFTAADRLGVLPTRCVAFEDSLAGLASAEASGAKVVGVQLLIPIPPAPGRSRLERLDQIVLDDLRRILAGDVIDLL